MEHMHPRGLNRRRVEQLLAKAKNGGSAAIRIDILSRAFLECSYKPNPLIGSADKAEVFTASLDGFDCVTYIETVVALARASDSDDFAEYLRRIRYEGGCVRWERRNHYMTAWIKSNAREGMIKIVSSKAVPMVSRERLLDVVPGLAARRTTMKYMAKRSMPRLKPYLQTGDLIFFVSTRKHLDVFHAGIVVRNDHRILMRHASRSQGSVVEQELSGFLKANRMAGVIVVRPQMAAAPAGVRNHADIR